VASKFKAFVFVPMLASTLASASVGIATIASTTAAEFVATNSLTCPH
jgi:hypothetical protein